MSAFVRVADLPAQRIWDGVSARPLHGERVTLAVIELDPDCVLPEHSHEHEQSGILVRGELELRVADTTQTMRPGAMWLIPSNVPHEARTGAEGAVVVEVWSPPRGDWAALPAGSQHRPLWPAT